MTDKKLEGMSRTGNTVNQAPINLPANPEQKHIVADSESIFRTKNKVQLRKWARQKINALARRHQEIPKNLIQTAERPGRNRK